MLLLSIKRFLSIRIVPTLIIAVGFGGATATVQSQYEGAKQQHQEVQNELQQKNEDLERRIQDLTQQKDQLQHTVQDKDSEIKQTSQQLQDAEHKLEQAGISFSSRDDSVTARTVTVKATAYSADPAENGGTYQGKVLTKTGYSLTDNPNAKVIAVDPDIIPLGSSVWVEGYGFAKAIDTGSAIQGNHIDIFMNDKERMNQWGVRNVQVKILTQ